MCVWVLPTANSLDVIHRVRETLPEIRLQLPAGMQAGIPYDSTEYIQDAISEVLTTLTETLLIVIVVIFLFLGSMRSVLIPVVAIPISLIGAVFLMLVAGFTINLLTLLAIVLSVGLVVDDAIVMVENVERHLEMGKTPFQAAKDAARELVGPIIAMTITLAAVYEAGLRRVSRVPGEWKHVPDYDSKRRVRRHGDQAVEPAHEDHAAVAGGVYGAALEDCRRSRDSADSAAVTGRRKLPGRLRDRLGR